jgi:hypothetical protein
MTAPIANAGFDNEFEEFRYQGNQGARDACHGRDVVVTHNHINLIPAQYDEIDPVDQIDDESLTGQIPGLMEAASASLDGKT